MGENGVKIFLWTRVDEGVAGGQRNVAAPRLMCSRGKLSAEIKPKSALGLPFDSSPNLPSERKRRSGPL